LLARLGGGLLIKNGGGTSVSWKGYSLRPRESAPDGHIWRCCPRPDDQRSDLAGQRFVDRASTSAIDPR